MEIEDKIKVIEEVLDYRFSPSNHKILIRALTTDSHAKEHWEKGKEGNRELIESQGGLRTLGDAVLKSIQTEYLYGKMLEEYSQEKQRIEGAKKWKKDWQKAWITNKRKDLEDEGALFNAAIKLRIEPIHIGGSEKNSTEKERLYAETFEAIIGALFLDCGYEKCKEVVLRIFPNKIND